MNADERIEIIKYNESKQKEWDGFVRQSKNGYFMFCRDYMDYHKDRFKDHSLMFYKDGSIIAIMPSCEADNVLKSHGGLTCGGILSNNNMRQSVMMDCVDALIEYCKTQEISRIEYKSVPFIYHKQPSEEDIYALACNGFRIKKIEASTTINLRKPIEKSKLRKRQIKKAERAGIIIDVCDSNKEISDFMELQNAILLRRHGVTAVHSASEMILLRERFASNIVVYLAKKKNNIVAGSVVYITDDVVHTQYLCANDYAREVGALDATIERIMSDYNTKHWFDFGISTENNGKYLNLGLIHQKEGFGGRTIIHSTWEKNIEA